jgi:transketolase
MQGFHRLSENAFFEAGIQEHHCATLAGAVSKEDFAAFFSTFGVFGVCETYNQHRLNDINETQLKLVCTHVGLDVGEDGQTHQCIDYLSLLQNLYGFSLFMPADPNQTDRVIRHIAENQEISLSGWDVPKCLPFWMRQEPPHLGEHISLFQERRIG